LHQLGLWKVLNLERTLEFDDGLASDLILHVA
jgi:hypothetical protein